MGINSTQVAYNFGQLGSVFTKHTSATIKAPEGKVFVAITFVDPTIFTRIDSETGYNPSGVSMTNFIGGSGHTIGDHEDDATHNNGGVDEDLHITLDAASTNIKPGMIIEHATMCPRSLSDPYKVVAVDDADITLNKPVAADYASSSADKKAQFYWEFSQGYGAAAIGTGSGGTEFPGGSTIFGRWTSMDVHTGSLIAYIGE
jgi:hypothetical protein